MNPGPETSTFSHRSSSSAPATMDSASSRGGRPRRLARARAPLAWKSAWSDERRTGIGARLDGVEGRLADGSRERRWCRPWAIFAPATDHPGHPRSSAIVAPGWPGDVGTYWELRACFWAACFSCLAARFSLSDLPGFLGSAVGRDFVAMPRSVGPGPAAAVRRDRRGTVLGVETRRLGTDGAPVVGRRLRGRRPVGRRSRDGGRGLRPGPGSRGQPPRRGPTLRTGPGAARTAHPRRAGPVVRGPARPSAATPAGCGPIWRSRWLSCTASASTSTRCTR